MKSIFSTFFILLFISYHIKAGDKNYPFISESQGDFIKFYWMVKEWPKDLEGFLVRKRKTNDKTGWIDLTPTTVYPENTRDKVLNNVFINYPEGLTNHLNIRQQMIDSGQLKEITRQDFYEKLSNPGFLPLLSLMFENDFSKALICGFGAIEKVTTEKEKYEYALFPVFSSGIAVEPVADFKWKSGQEDKIKFSFSDFMKEKDKKIGIDLTILSMKDNINGLNIYRKNSENTYDLLTAERINIGRGMDNRKVRFVDPDADPLLDHEYEVRPVTIFNTEGEPRQLVYKPYVHGDDSDLRINLKKPSLNGRNLSFGFEITNPRKIVLREACLTNGTEKSDGILECSLPGMGSINLLNNYEPGAAYPFQLRLITLNGQVLYSNKIEFFIPKPAPVDGPRLLAAAYEKVNEKRYIKLNWEKGPQQIAQKYSVFTYFEGRPILESSYHKIEGTSCMFEIKNSFAKKIRFAVAAVDENNNFSPKSNSIEVITPSIQLPNLQLDQLFQEEDQVVLQWNLPREKPLDLAGYIIYCDGIVVNKDQLISADLKEYRLPAPEAGMHRYAIAMVAGSGLRGAENFNARNIQVQ